MHEWVEQFDDRAIDLYRVWDVDRIAQDARDALGHRRLAVTRRTKQKQGGARHDRRADLVRQRIRREEIREGLSHPRTRHQVVIDWLRFD